MRDRTVDRREAIALTSVGLLTAAAPTVARSTVDPPWGLLAANLGNQLREVESPLERCIASGGAGADELFGKTLKNPFAISENPGLTQTLSWIGAWQSAPSARVVAARDARDVATSVDFAREHRVRLVTRGGGHSYFGNSNAAGSLLIWTRSMARIEQQDAFLPQGAPAETLPITAVSVGTGTLWGDVYRHTMVEAGRYVQGGGCFTVGVAGFTLGGGFGSFSKAFGTGAANLIEAEVVTADGHVRIVNAFKDPELFFALRGGGGGTFAVATRLTLRTHALPATVGAILFEVTAKDAAAWRELIGAAIEHYAAHLFNPHWGEQMRFSPGRKLRVTMLSQGRTEAEVRADWASLISWIEGRPDRLALARAPVVLVVPGQRFWDPAALRQIPDVVLADNRPGADPHHVFWASNLEEAGQQLYAYKSRWLPQSLLAGANRPRLADALVEASAHWSVAFHFNKGLAGGAPEALARTGETATNPQVLDAFALLIVAANDEPAWHRIPGHEPDLAEARRQAERVEAAFMPLAALSPGAGCYMSESDWYDAGWRRDYWGENYPRLFAAKRHYDPAGLFTGHHCVGT